MLNARPALTRCRAVDKKAISWMTLSSDRPPETHLWVTFVQSDKKRRLFSVHNGTLTHIHLEGFTQVYKALLYTMAPLLFVGVALSLLVRLRRAVGVERQQMKWFTSAIVALVGSSVVASAVSDATGVKWLEDAGFWLSIAGIVSLPVAVGIAILRYRLYEIDLIINRALVYGPLTATLVLVYLGGVVSLQYAFRALTGQGSQIAIVASTLAIAALFNPLRRRVQGLVDRRFYRKKYDARKTVEAFSEKLRDETDLQRLGEHLVGVVGEAMKPAHASLWLRPAPDRRAKEKASSRSIHPNLIEGSRSGKPRQ